MSKVVETMSLSGGWNAEYNIWTNAITAIHRDGYSATFSQEEIEAELVRLVKQANGSHFALIKIFSNLSNRDDAFSQAVYAATCQCGYDKPYRKKICAEFGAPCIF